MGKKFDIHTATVSGPVQFSFHLPVLACLEQTPSVVADIEIRGKGKQSAWILI